MTTFVLKRKKLFRSKILGIFNDLDSAVYEASRRKETNLRIYQNQYNQDGKKIKSEEIVRFIKSAKPSNTTNV